MPEIHVISQISLTEDGPAVTKTIKHKNGPQLIHLQQGSLDGACGPYCLCMALITLGFEKHSKLSNVFSDNALTSQNLFDIISDNSSALIREGTDLNQLTKYVKDYEKKGLKYKRVKSELHGSSKVVKEQNKKHDHARVRDFVIEHILVDHVVLLASQYHWVLVVGLEYENLIPKKDEDVVDPRLFFVLDPSESSPKFSVWNGIIDISGKGKGNNWFGSGSHAFYDALALWKE